MLEAFLRGPVEAARAAGLDAAEASAIAEIDRTGLIMAAASFRAKRRCRKRRRRSFPWPIGGSDSK
ncbi:MAG: hypothetical protein JO122_04740 [Acetobacteraceae bacterium]|nr:hypothetical protein [Acetobacteraceae bacterium]